MVVEIDSAGAPATSAPTNSTTSRPLERVAADASLAEAAKVAPLDELFALRFVLSAKKNDVAVATENLLKTLAYRAANLGELDKARKQSAKNQDTFNKYSKTGFLGYLGGLHPVFVVRAGRADTKEIMRQLSIDEVAETLLLQTEYMFMLADTKTRETGLLCKILSVVDLEGMSLFTYDSKFPKALGKSSHMSAVYYPQLTGRTVIINLPSALKFLFMVFRNFMSASAVEKQTVCPGRSLKQSADECPFLAKFASASKQAPGPVDAVLPPFLGGRAPCPAYLRIAEVDDSIKRG